MKLLHAADFHLDSAFSSLPPEKAVGRRKEQRLALERLAEACRDCDVVLLAGDLFDSARIYRDSVDALKAFFASVDAEIFVAPGNHDHLTGGSPYLTENWGENVHIFTKPTIERIRLEKLNCDVYGAGFTAPEMPTLLEGFRVADPGAVNLMVLHGDLQPHSPYNPIQTAEIFDSGLDYLALGHVHKDSVQTIGKTTCVYPGCLMGRGFDECGQKGVYRVEITNNGCKTEFVPILTRKYEILTVAAGDEPLSSILAALPEDTENDCYRILLTGESGAVDTDALEGALSARFFSLSVRDRTVPKRELWAAAGEDTLRGHSLAVLKRQYDAAEGSERRKLAMAARMITDLLDGREATV